MYTRRNNDMILAKKENLVLIRHHTKFTCHACDLQVSTQNYLDTIEIRVQVLHLPYGEWK